MTETKPKSDFFIPPLLIVIVVVALLCGGYIWWSDQDHRPRAALGQVFGADDFTGGDETAVVTPIGKLTVRFGEPITELPTPPGASPREHRAPKKGSFVAVAISAETPAAGAVLRTDKATEAKLPDLTLVADGHRYSLNELLPSRPDSLSPMFGSSAGYLAVAGKPQAAQLEVNYDGERGLFGVRGGATEPGRFSDQQEQAGPTPEGSCGRPVASPAFAQEDLARACQLGVVRAQYVAGLGWAAADKEWVAVAIRTTAPIVSGYLQDRYVSYNPTEPRTISYRFANDPDPARLSGKGAAPVLFTSVQEGSTTTLTVGLRYGGLKNLPNLKDGAPRTMTVTATWTVANI